MRSPFHDNQRAIATAAEVIKFGGRFDLVAGNRNIKAKTANKLVFWVLLRSIQQQLNISAIFVHQRGATAGLALVLSVYLSNLRLSIVKDTMDLPVE
jgi:hypothetical protein